jgi:predicted RNase H-like nuclease
MTVAAPLPPSGAPTVGIDGCRAGWVWCRRGASGWDGGVAASIDALTPVLDTAALALIDMPIGLVSQGPDERACDRAARALLGRPRASSVFRPPCRAALAAGDYAGACAINRRCTGVALSQQTWHIAAKIRELDRALTAAPGLCERLLEAHPELCFWGLAGGRPMAHNKRTPQGQAERVRVLQALEPACVAHMATLRGEHPRAALATDDIADATVLAVTAAAALGSDACRRRLPAVPEHDALGLPMALLYVHAGTRGPPE